MNGELQIQKSQMLMFESEDGKFHIDVRFEPRKHAAIRRRIGSSRSHEVDMIVLNQQAHGQIE